MILSKLILQKKKTRPSVVETKLTFEKGIACLQLSGELNQNNLQHDFWVNLAHDEAKNIVQVKKLVVELGDLVRVDTAGLAWLINIVKDARVKQVTVSFNQASEELLNLANLSGAKQLIEV